MKTKPTIHTVYVPIESQSQADKLKAVCIDYGLPIFQEPCAFDFDSEVLNYFAQESHLGEPLFAIWLDVENYPNTTEVTEPQFIALCEEWVKNK